MIDAIPLSDLIDVEEMGDFSTLKKKSQPNESHIDKMNIFENALRIDTSPVGYNFGRTYYLQCQSPELLRKIVMDLKVAAEIARAKLCKRSFLLRSQKYMRDVIHSTLFQCFTGTMIVAVCSFWACFGLFNYDCIDFLFRIS